MSFSTIKVSKELHSALRVLAAMLAEPMGQLAEQILAKGIRDVAAERRLDMRSIFVDKLFAEGDDGFHYLHNRLGRHLCRVLRRGVVRVEVVEGIDHGMHRAWLRPAVAKAVVAQLGRLA